MNNEGFILKVEGITKRFPGVLALDNISFDLKPGEVHVLLGENGAGKSTLIKILSGAYKYDKGKIFIDGKEEKFNNTQHAMELGIATCYQEFNLIPYLSVAENMFLGRFPKFKNNIVPVIDKLKMQKESQKVVDSMGINLDVKKSVNKLGVAQKQMVEIAKSLLMNAKIYILDEPTAVLGKNEIDELFRVINSLKLKGCGIIYISHRLEELPIIGDRVTVLRDGKKISTNQIKNTTVDKLIEMMVGVRIENIFPKVNTTISRELLRVENLCKEEIFKDININVKAGEIVGIAGLVGSKRTEVARSIFGADKISSGKIFFDGEEVKITAPRKAVSIGICYLPEDRKELGLVLGMSVKDNISLPSVSKHTKGLVINDNILKTTATAFVKKLGIKTPSLQQKVKNLSGGNQQKIVIAKWLASGCKVFIFDEPTRGIDVKAKIEVYNLMNDIIKKGAGIIMISSEMIEIVNMCDRAYVMSNGKIRVELLKEKLSQENILKYEFYTDCADELLI